ncbi:hypothetical protein GX865_02070 [Candidatus Saccharibacteria bacterium]|nr:hypothetical protein [Candidatus Saccharibacteria bacterium]
MKQGRNTQILPVIIIIIVIVVSVAAIVALVRTFILNGGSDSNNSAIERRNADEEALLSTSVDRGVRMSIRGEITADEKFRSYQIVIRPGSRSMTTNEG